MKKPVLVIDDETLQKKAAFEGIQAFLQKTFSIKLIKKVLEPAQIE